MDNEDNAPITQKGMIEMFGESMPIEAVNLVFDAPPEMTCGELRRQLRAMAASRPKAPTSMIERMARAMDAALVENTDNDTLAWDLTLGQLTEVVHAVLAAMREPTPGMVEAGIALAEEVEDWITDSVDTFRVGAPSDMPRPVWQAMIDAAAKEVS